MSARRSTAAGFDARGYDLQRRENFAYQYQNLNSDGSAMTASQLPGLQAGPFGDNYLYPHLQVDAQGTVRLAKGFSVLAYGLNLSNEVFGFYNGSPDYVVQREYYGPTFGAGVRWTPVKEQCKRHGGVGTFDRAAKSRFVGGGMGGWGGFIRSGRCAASTALCGDCDAAGVRSPTANAARLNQYSAPPWPEWGVSPGYLTAHGRALMTIMGAYYREWLAGAGLLRSQGCEDQERTYIHADTDQRTLETGRAMAESLLPGCPSRSIRSRKASRDRAFRSHLGGRGPPRLGSRRKGCPRALGRPSGTLPGVAPRRFRGASACLAGPAARRRN